MSWEKETHTFCFVCSANNLNQLPPSLTFSPTQALLSWQYKYSRELWWTLARYWSKRKNNGEGRQEDNENLYKFPVLQLVQYNSSSAVTKDPAKMWKQRAGWRKDLRGLTSQCHWQEDTWFQFKILSTSSKHLTSLLCFQDTNSNLRGLTEWNNVSLWRYQHDKSSVVLIIYICCSL